ncbi:unnamed protein product [Spirodela intermedia]|uniref:TOD1/MUCI70 glycosyltransferase-like domain-containing protein n=1 Tax=Spirodela intermedia TaxID=51605 RepID=A0A7I8J6R5_SPIIN|nr:unnamed protein product [Spirodela intermedia]CAA6665093.1 unnamed protein product [Spirodela intermedia]
MRTTRRTDRIEPKQRSDVKGGGPFSPRKLSQDPWRMIWRRGFIRLVFVSAIIWILLMLIALLFHVWTCQSTTASPSAVCRRHTKMFLMLESIIVPKPLHRCPIPVLDDPYDIVIPKGRTPDNILKDLQYSMWKQREDSFKVNETMKVHCGFMKDGGGDMDAVDVKYVKRCRFVVASGIFDGYDTPHQPTNISRRSEKLFCFLMVVDEKSLSLIEQNVTVREDNAGGKWVGIWRLVTLHNLPYDEPRRNGKVPKILTHRLFPQAQYSIWIDGKMELLVDPLLMLERYLWRGNYTFAIATHKHHRSIYEEGDAIKRRKRYARPLIDLHMKIYRYEGMELWRPDKGTVSDVPEGAVIIREHTAVNNLFMCLWFNEVDLFTPRDQLSFGYVAFRLRAHFRFFMFPNCEYNSLFNLHRHTREHSSVVEWVKSLDELTGSNATLKESRGGLGLWTPYPANLTSVEVPFVRRGSLAGRR